MQKYPNMLVHMGFFLYLCRRLRAAHRHTHVYASRNMKENNQNIEQAEGPMMQEPMQPQPVPGPMMASPAPRGWRNRLRRQLMSGIADGVVHLPEWFAVYAVATYAIALVGVNVLFLNHAMEWYFWLFGIAWVAGFFYLSVKFSREWSILRIRKSRIFEQKLFWTGFWIRAAYAVFIYFFYFEMTGQPYEFAAADSIGYMETATDWAIYWEHGIFWTKLMEYAKTSFSDMGYPLSIFLPIHWFGVDASLLILRLINAFFGAFTSVLVYRFTRRMMGETTARFAAIFCMLHPVLICYVGMTLKEVIMTWLLVLFVDLADRLLVGKRYTFITIAPLALTGFSLFTFRTVLGLVAIMAVFFALVMMDRKMVSWGKKVVLGVVLAGAVLIGASDNIMREVNILRDTDVRQQQEISMTKRYGSEKEGKVSGNRFANYAGAAVFAPMIFTIPFPTMVITEGQEGMRLIHGGNWMRNIMSGFVIFALILMLLSGDWRHYTLPVAMELGYLVVLVFSAFAHSLRFHIPVMPFEMMFAAYAITNMRKKHQRWYLYWCVFMIVTCFAWNWFKLAGRGL